MTVYEGVVLCTAREDEITSVVLTAVVYDPWSTPAGKPQNSLLWLCTLEKPD